MYFNECFPWLSIQLLSLYLDFHNNTINRPDDHCFQIIYSKTTSFKYLLEKDNLTSICHRNNQTFAIEMLKVTNGNSPETTMKHFNYEKNLIITYLIHLSLQFHLLAVFIMAENLFISFKGPKIWVFIPHAVRHINPLYWILKSN